MLSAFRITAFSGSSAERSRKNRARYVTAMTYRMTQGKSAYIRSILSSMSAVTPVARTAMSPPMLPFDTAARMSDCSARVSSDIGGCAGTTRTTCVRRSSLSRLPSAARSESAMLSASPPAAIRAAIRAAASAGLEPNTLSTRATLGIGVHSRDEREIGGDVLRRQG